MLYKRWISWVITLGVILMGVFVFQAPVKAEGGALYSITDYTSNISLYDDGSVYFDESITYQLQEEEVEITKPIPMAYSSKLEDMEVIRRVSVSGDSMESNSSENNFEDMPLKQAETTDSTYKDTYNFLQVDEDNDIHHIITPVQGSKREEVTFVYRYKMLDTVFLYKDTATFFWNYIQENQNVEVKNILIEVTLPDTVAIGDWDGYTRGAAFAQKELIEDGIFRITAEKVSDEEFLESVLLIPKSLFPNGRKIVDNLAKDEIVSEMSAWEDEAARIRQLEELRFYGGWGISILSILLSLGIGFILYYKTRTLKRKNLTATDLNEKGIPDSSLTPAEVGILVNGKLGMKEFFATVLSLVQSRFLELGISEKQEGFFTLREDIQRINLKAHEEYVLNWLVGGMGNGQSLSLETLDDLLNSYNKSHEHKIATWESLVYGRAGKRGMYENITRIKVWAMVGVILSLIAAILAGWKLGNYQAGILAGIFALALAAYILPLKKSNEKHRLQLAQWEKYKEELIAKYSNVEDSLPLTRWEEHFVYAMPLGIAKEMLERLIQNYESKDFEDGNLTILYLANHSWIMETLQR